MKQGNKILVAVALLAFLSQAALGSDPEIAYMISGTQRYIAVMDSDGSNKTKVYQPPKFSPFLLEPSWSPDGLSLAFADQSTLYRINVDHLTVYPDGMLIAPREGTFWDGASYVAYNGLIDATWSPAGGLIAARTIRPATVCVIDEWGAGDLQMLYMPLDGETLRSGGRLTWNSDGSMLAFFVTHENGDNDLVILDLLEGSLDRITAASVGAPPGWSQPDWARRDDPRIAFYEGDWVHTFNTVTGEIVQQIVEGAWPTWSPDNTKIAVRLFPGKIERYDLVTGELLRLGSGNYPDWSRSIVEPECAGDDDCDSGICCDGFCFVPCANDTDCDDSDTCTTDYCLNPGGCDAYCEYPPNVEPCDDGNPCTFGDTCSAGACAGTVIDEEYNADCGGWCCAGECRVGATGCECLPKGEVCTENGQCCSGQCHPVKGVCK